MTPHSERDEYAAMESNTPKVKPSRVRPVVPLKYTQDRKSKSSISAPAQDVASAPAVESSDAAAASVNSASTPIEDKQTQTVPEQIQPQQEVTNNVTTAEQSSSEASLSVDGKATTDSGKSCYTIHLPSYQTSLAFEIIHCPVTLLIHLTATQLSASSTQTEASAPHTEKPEEQQGAQEQEVSGETPLPPAQEAEQAQEKPESSVESTNMAMHPPQFSQATMPPPGFHHIPTGFSHQSRHGINGNSINGANGSETSTASPAQANFHNGIMSPPSETLVNAPAFVPGHSHHMSNTNTPITKGPPQSVFPPPGFEARPPISMVSELASPSFDGLASGNINGDAYVVNGHSHPGSRTMSHSSRGHPEIVSSQEEAFRTSFNHASMQNQDLTNGRMRNGSIPMPPMMVPMIQQPDPAIDSALMIRDYLLSQFGLSDLADYILQVFRGEERLLSIPVHSLLAVRSPTLFKLISALRYTNDGSRYLKLEIGEKIFVEQAFVEALQFVYGAPLATAFMGMVNRVPPFNTRDLNGETAKFARHVLTHALSLTSSGLSLQLEPVALHGADLAKRLIRWDTLEVALNFILVNGLPQGWRSQESNGDANRLKGIAMFGDGVKSQLLGAVIDYLAINFPHHFEFNAAASQFDECPRLPLVLDAKPSVSNHRLSRIQFGQLPAEQPDFVTSTLSSILLSLPFEPLKALFGHPALLSRGKGFNLVNIAESVVAERENRRNRVLESKRISPRGEGALWDATQWQESVILNQQNPGGMVIVRRRIEK